MTLSSILILFLLGLSSLRRYRKAKSSGAPLPRRTYRCFFLISGILLLNGIAAMLYWYPHIVRVLYLEALLGIPLLLLFGGLWWFLRSVRDGWVSRGILLVLIFLFGAASGWRILRAHRIAEESARTLENLHRCADLLAEGRHRELKQYMRSAPDTSLREWNDSFERNFPAEGAKK